VPDNPVKKAKPIVSDPIPLQFYPPGYAGKAPEEYPASVIEALARARNELRRLKKLNKTADKFFLANALTENRPFDEEGSHGVLPGTFSERESDRIIDVMMKLPQTQDPDLLKAYRYGAVLDYKTGRFTDAVEGKNAGDSIRLSRWNGKGKSVEAATGHRADAENHASKVMRLREELEKNPKNAGIMQYFKKMK
jgi:hypothetical protein